MLHKQKENENFKVKYICKLRNEDETFWVSASFLTFSYLPHNTEAFIHDLEGTGWKLLLDIVIFFFWQLIQLFIKCGYPLTSSSEKETLIPFTYSPPLTSCMCALRTSGERQWRHFLLLYWLFSCTPIYLSAPALNVSL